MNRSGRHDSSLCRDHQSVKLADFKKQDIIRDLDTGKYRFPLFDDKREVELVWNGKINEDCNVVLLFQMIEQLDEPRVEKGIIIRMSLV